METISFSAYFTFITRFYWLILLSRDTFWYSPTIFENFEILECFKVFYYQPRSGMVKCYRFCCCCLRRLAFFVLLALCLVFQCIKLYNKAFRDSFGIKRLLFCYSLLNCNFQDCYKFLWFFSKSLIFYFNLFISFRCKAVLVICVLYLHNHRPS